MQLRNTISRHQAIPWFQVLGFPPLSLNDWRLGHGHFKVVPLQHNWSKIMEKASQSLLQTCMRHHYSEINQEAARLPHSLSVIWNICRNSNFHMQTQTQSGTPKTTYIRVSWNQFGVTWKSHLKRLRTVQYSLVCKRTWTGWHAIACWAGWAGWIKGQIKSHVSADLLFFLAQDLHVLPVTPLGLHQEVCTKDVCLVFLETLHLGTPCRQKGVGKDEFTSLERHHIFLLLATFHATWPAKNKPWNWVPKRNK